MPLLRYSAGLVIGGLTTALAYVLWLNTRPPLPPAAGLRRPPPVPSIVFDKVHPDLLTIGDPSFQVTLALDPPATVKDWWWMNHGGIVRVTVDGTDFVSPRGLPEHWDIDGFEAPSDQARLNVEGGWSRAKGATAEGSPLPETRRSVAIEGNAMILTVEVPAYGGYAHRYRKRIAVEPWRHRIAVECVLANLGEKPLHLRHFVHGYLNLGGGPVDGRYEIDTALRPDAIPEWLVQRPAGFAIGRAIAKPEFAPHNRKILPSGLANRLVLRNRENHCCVTMAGDFPPHWFALYVEAEAVVPEITIKLDLAPGQSAEWRRTWEFQTEEATLP